MPDVFTKRKRSEVMSRIRGKGNKDTEIALAKLLRASGIVGWRRQEKVRIEGGKRRSRRERPTTAKPPRQGTRPTTTRPDFIFPRERVVVFVDGCFWHGCPVHSSPARWLKRSSMTARMFTTKSTKGTKTAGRTGKAFWASKMAANIARDKFVTRKLRRDGWRVVRIWEHELAKNSARCVQRIRKAMIP
jgi:DNA mismatch endonuclease, patch repair protein